MWLSRNGTFLNGNPATPTGGISWGSSAGAVMYPAFYATILSLQARQPQRSTAARRRSPERCRRAIRHGVAVTDLGEKIFCRVIGSNVYGADTAYTNVVGPVAPVRMRRSMPAASMRPT